ncbi:MAG TPA: MerR family transcriptional regulator [Jiangellaceae bacterium]
MDDDLLPIGAFARLCRLSVKQLRHYDELGLLVPTHVDPASGYRYYRRDQARAALSIGLLRSLDVPLAAIGAVLSGRHEVLDDVRHRLEGELARRQRTLGALDRIVARGLPGADVRVVQEPARTVVTVSDLAEPERIGEVTSACMARLLAVLGGTPRGTLVGLFPLDLGDELRVSVAGELAADHAGTGQAGEPGAELTVLPGGTFALATHVGPYDQINLTAYALLAWCGDHGHSPVGPLREVYVSNPRETPPDRLVTQVMIGLEDR